MCSDLAIVSLKAVYKKDVEAVILHCSNERTAIHVVFSFYLLHFFTPVGMSTTFMLFLSFSV